LQRGRAPPISWRNATNSGRRQSGIGRSLSFLQKSSKKKRKEIKMQLLWFLLIGLAAGWLASAVMGSRLGLVGDLIVGVIGAFLGGYLFSLFGFSSAGLLGSLLTAFVGAIVLILLLRVSRTA
jgi:uncharacterized membrane protein YeaQ/YmgE (transglycosylase-associated protein family)